MMYHRRTLVLAVCLLSLVVGCRKGTPVSDKVIRINPGPKAQEEAQTALIKAKPGDTIEFAAGTFEFTQSLSLAVENITIRGQGMDKTTLSFKKQEAGKEGLLVTRGPFVLEDLSIDDAKGDAVKVNDVEGVTFRRVRAQWTGGAKETNGAYGLYPVQCKNVLIEECVAIGASDAGIYVGQSQNIIVRKCRAERNVAGIEIENCTDADVYDNVATNNAGGLLVFDLPGLPVKKGQCVRVFNNQVIANNHANFAAKGNLVASVAPGTGLMVMATEKVEVFENIIKDNQTYNLAVVSFHITGRPIKDKDYDPIPAGVYIHDNTFASGGANPTGERGQVLEALCGKPVPDIIYDGISDPAKKSPTLRLKNNGMATFANLNWGELPDLSKLDGERAIVVALLNHRAKVQRNPMPYEGELPALPAVTLPGVP